MADKIFTDYITYNKALTIYASKNSSIDSGLVGIIFKNAHAEYMAVLKLANFLRMPFYVFTPAQVKIIESMADARAQVMADVNPLIEVLFRNLNSKGDIDKYFQLWFNPMTGSSSAATVDAYKLSAEFLNIPYSSTMDIANVVNSMTLDEYAQFYIVYATAMQVFAPEVFSDGIDRAQDYVQGILFNLENFSGSSDPAERTIAYTALIINSLALPVDNIVFQDSYLMNLNLSLLTRGMVNNISEVMPSAPNLDYPRAIIVWRNNIRIKLGDITGTIQAYPFLPEKDSWQKKLGMGAAAFIAIALVAPYVIQGATAGIKAGAAKLSALGSAAVGSSGSLPSISVGAALKEEIAELKNAALSLEWEKALEDIIESETKIEATKEVIDETKTALAPTEKKSNLILPASILGLAILTGMG